MIPSGDEVDGVEDLERVEVIAEVARRALSYDLSKAERRAIDLMKRGGNYTAAERMVMSRVRARLRAMFEDLEYVVIGLPIRWNRFRSWLKDPPPAVPAVLALVGTATLGGVMSSNPAAGDDIRPSSTAVTAHASTRQTATAFFATTSQPSSAEPTPTAHRTPKPRGERPAQEPPVVAASTTARVPGAGQDGGANITIHEPDSGRSAWADVPIYCDSPSSPIWRRACQAIPAVPPAG